MIELAAGIVIIAYGRIPLGFLPGVTTEQLVAFAKELIASDDGATIADKPGALAAARSLG